MFRPYESLHHAYHHPNCRGKPGAVICALFHIQNIFLCDFRTSITAEIRGRASTQTNLADRNTVSWIRYSIVLQFSSDFSHSAHYYVAKIVQLIASRMAYICACQGDAILPIKKSGIFRKCGFRACSDRNKRFPHDIIVMRRVAEVDGMYIT